MTTATLTEDQRKAMAAVRGGTNVFLTGPPGTGKSFLVRHLREWALATGRTIGVTAMTGCAAVLLNGQTLHSFLGIGLASNSPVQMAAFAIRRMPKVVKRIKALDILLVDEISMMDASLMDKVSEYMAIVRQEDAAFGGVQMVVVGDLCQLPPLSGAYCFRSAAWREADFHTIALEANMRQKEDPVFVRLLAALRWGTCGRAERESLREMLDTEFDAHIVPTRLYALNADVDRINDDAFDKLVRQTGASVVEHPPRFPRGAPLKASKAWADACRVGAPVRLCVGAQVMLTRNVDAEAGLVNGARGVVEDATPGHVTVRFLAAGLQTVSYFKAAQDADPTVWVEYLPLRLAWAISIHKSQGMTLDAVEVDLGKSIFAPGMAYTALSRAKNMASVRITSLDPRAFQTSQEVCEFYGHEDA